MSINLEPASFVSDLRQSPPIIRYPAMSTISFLAAYLATFGLLALFGKWRGAFFGRDQLMLAFAFAALLSVHYIAFKGARLWIPAAVGVIASIFSTVPRLGDFGPSDLPDFVIVVALPIAFAFAHALTYRRLNG